MTPDRWRRVEDLYRAARDPEKRAEVLAEADPELRREVEALLAQQPGGRASTHHSDETIDPTLTMAGVGTQLGPYQIEAPIGKGGMGQVFRAVDTRLGRKVAIKVSHERFDPRFEREARAISALNHPNICTLYDVGSSSSGVGYLVMELLEGETVAARLKRGKLSTGEALRYGVEIAAALAAAHAKGITHRDLKPANVMLTESGVKVLDFGLAKSQSDATMTASNMVVGTPAYMAPEQFSGEEADERTDIFALGLLLYEMCSGIHLSAGSPMTEITPEVRRIISKCVENDRSFRYQHASELRTDLQRLKRDEEAAQTTPSASAIAPARAASRWKIAIAAVVALAGISVGAYAYLHRTPKLTDKDTIVLADFDNKTGDPVFDDTLRQGLAVELQQSPFLSLVPDTQIRQTLTLMGQPKDAPLTSEIAQQVCERTGSAAILEGSIASLGSQYVLGLHARNCTTGSILDQEQIQVARREDILNSLSQIGRKFRTTVGESLATVEQHSTPLAEATTASLEALKVYSTGMKVNLSSGSAAALPFFRRAVEIDPQFALAHAVLGLSYSGVGESVLSAQSTTRAWQLRDRVTDQEKFYIDFSYDRQVTGNLEKAYQTLELWLQTYPRQKEPNARGLLGGLSSQGTGRYQRAIEMSEQETAADPGFVFGYANAAAAYFFLDRFIESERTLQSAAERKLEMPELQLLRYLIAFLKGDQKQMDEISTLAQGKTTLGHWMAHQEALVLARSGQLRTARRSSSRAVDLARQEGDRETSASYLAARAVWEAVCGNAVEGKKDAMAAIELSNGGRDLEYAAGLALAFSGDSSRSESLAGDLDKRFPEDTFAKFTYVPVLRALGALQRGKPADSIEKLQVALPYELAVNGLNFGFYLGGLHSAYVRGEAFLAAEQYAEAASEFQKILDHRGIVSADPIGALAHLQLGRTYAHSGDKTKAKAAYQDFLLLWKDADADVPVLKLAKAEYAKLQ